MSEQRRENKSGEAAPLGAYLAVGILQGLVLWLISGPYWHPLYEGHPAAFIASVQFAVYAPIAWYLLAGGSSRPLARAGIALCIAALVSGLGGHAASTSEGGWPTSYVCASAVLAYMLVVLASGFDRRSGWFSYPALFDHGWRNILLAAAAGALSGILWALLWAAAFLLEALGVDTLSRSLSEPLILALLWSASFAAFIRQASLRGEALVAMRKFWLTLNTWFLPLALLLAAVWVVALLAIGIQPLFETRRTALLLFWFVALAVLFMNAAYQDGRALPYAPRVATLITWGWLLVPVLAAIGLWALSARVAQHGWSVDRLWATLVGVMALIYGVGYGSSSFTRSRWMASVESTNIVAALALAVMIVLFTSPVADFRKIAVDSQVARLRSGQVAASEFDFEALKREGGHWGRLALTQMVSDTSLAAPVRARAKAQLHPAVPDPNEQNPEHALGALRDQVTVLPKGVVPDPLLLALLSRREADWDERMCVKDPESCALWIVDMDGDGASEAVVLRDSGKWVEATIYGKSSEGWRREAPLDGPMLPFAEWVKAIESGTATPVKPRWLELQLMGQRHVARLP